MEIKDVGGEKQITTYYESDLKDIPIGYALPIIFVFVFVLIAASYNAYTRKKERIQGELDMAYNMYK